MEIFSLASEAEGGAGRAPAGPTKHYYTFLADFLFFCLVTLNEVGDIGLFIALVTFLFVGSIILGIFKEF